MSLNAVIGRLFSWQGRATRKEFAGVWFLTLCVGVISSTPMLFYFLTLLENSIDFSVNAAFVMAEDNALNPIFLFCWYFFFSVIGSLLSVGTIFTACRRLNDLEWSLWNLLITLVPVLNLFFLLVLFFKRGKVIA